MIDIPTIDELREVRRRLAEQAGGDVQRYAESLRKALTDDAAPRIERPLTPPGTESPERSSAA